MRMSSIILLLMLPFTMGILQQTSECGQSLGCIMNPESTLLFTWQPNLTYVVFTLRGDVKAVDLYLAVGLSHDDKMGDDDVMECVRAAGSVQVFSSYNTGHSNLRYEDPSLLNKHGVYENGILECTFSLPVNQTKVTGQRKHKLDQPWHVQLVWGHLVPGTTEKQHHIYKSVSPSKVSLLAAGSFHTQKLSTSLARLHGCLMMFAWVTVTSVAIMIARHYKGLLPETEVCGKKIWFQVHRVLMSLVVLLTLAGIIVIFVAVGGYSQATDTFQLLHPILGLMVTGLSLLNPVVALFRPLPDAPRRPIFNWTHRCIGTGSQVIAVVTTFMGLKLKTITAPSEMLYVLAAFVAWHVFVETLLFCIGFVKRRKQCSLQDQGPTSPHIVDRKLSPLKVTEFHEILLMLHSSVAVATAIFLFALFLSDHHTHS